MYFLSLSLIDKMRMRIVLLFNIADCDFNKRVYGNTYIN